MDIVGLPGGELAVLAGTLLVGGFATGILAGLFGIGGGGIIVPILYELFRVIGVDDDIRIQVCIGTSLAIIIPTSIRSVRAHMQRGAVDTDLIKRMAVAVVAGVVLGSLIAKVAPSEVLRAIFAAGALTIAVKLFFARDSWQLGDEMPGALALNAYGLFIGLISTLMGIGGGAFVTAMMTLYGRTIHNAVATAAGFGPVIAIPAMFGFIWAGWGDPGLPPGSLGFVNFIGVALMVPTSILAAPLGVKLAHGMSKRALQRAFACFLTVIALRFIVSLI